MADAERRTHFWHQLVLYRAKRGPTFGAHRVFETVHDRPGLARRDAARGTRQFSRKDALRSPLSKRQRGPLPAPSEIHPDKQITAEFVRTRLPYEERPVRGTRQVGREHGHDLPPYRPKYHAGRGRRWPVVDGKETSLAHREGYDPYVKPGEGHVLRPAGRPGEVILVCRTSRRWNRRKRRIRVLACHRPRARTRAFRLDDDARPGARPRFPGGRVFMTSDDAASAASAGRRAPGRVPPRRYLFAGRYARPNRCPVAYVCAVVRCGPADQ